MILFKVLTSPINLKQVVTSLQNVLKKARDALCVQRKETRKEPVATKKYPGLWGEKGFISINLLKGNGLLSHVIPCFREANNRSSLLKQQTKGTLLHLHTLRCRHNTETQGYRAQRRLRLPKAPQIPTDETDRSYWHCTAVKRRTPVWNRQLGKATTSPDLLLTRSQALVMLSGVDGRWLHRRFYILTLHECSVLYNLSHVQKILTY